MLELELDRAHRDRVEHPGEGYSVSLTPPSSLAPVTVTVSGSVAVTSVAGTVAISAASLPLPTGAATEATLDSARDSLNDVALTAILEREKITP